jgi:hypothetical protein
VKPDRHQLLPIPCALSLSSKNTATTKPEIRIDRLQSLILLLLSIGKSLSFRD